MTRGKIPTTTSLVLNYLRERDDLVTFDEITEATGRSNNQVSAALFHLGKRHAVDNVEQVPVSYFFALPEHEDTRMRQVEERTPEHRPRQRGSKKRK